LIRRRGAPTPGSFPFSPSLPPPSRA